MEEIRHLVLYYHVTFVPGPPAVARRCAYLYSYHSHAGAPPMAWPIVFERPQHTHYHFCLHRRNILTALSDIVLFPSPNTY